MHWSERQARFAKALSDPALPPPEFFATRDVSARFNVYRNNVAVARIETLRAQFPVALALVGDEFFAAMARVFVWDVPQRSLLLADYGADFPDFIACFALAAEVPYLADVARLEFLCLRAQDAADRAPLSTAQIAAIPVEALLDARLEFHPAFGLIDSTYPIVAIWASHADEVIAIEDWSPQSALVLRPGAEVAVRACAAGSSAFIAAAVTRATLRVAAEAAYAVDPEFDFGQALVELIGIGAVVALAQSEEREDT